jgi:threonine/homoserine/homoserine lactone efflux protein
MVWQCVIAAMVDKAKIFLTTPKVARWFDGLVGTVLIAFGLKLALSEK